MKYLDDQKHWDKYWDENKNKNKFFQFLGGFCQRILFCKIFCQIYRAKITIKRQNSVRNWSGVGAYSGLPEKNGG